MCVVDVTVKIGFSFLFNALSFIFISYSFNYIPNCTIFKKAAWVYFISLYFILQQTRALDQIKHQIVTKPYLNPGLVNCYSNARRYRLLGYLHQKRPTLRLTDLPYLFTCDTRRYDLYCWNPTEIILNWMTSSSVVSKGHQTSNTSVEKIHRL